MEKEADKTGGENKATSINLAAGAHLKLMEETPETKRPILSERKNINSPLLTGISVCIE